MTLRVLARAAVGLAVLAAGFALSVGLSIAVGKPVPAIVTAFTELFVAAIILPAWALQPRRQSTAPPSPLRPVAEGVHPAATLPTVSPEAQHRLAA